MTLTTTQAAAILDDIQNTHLNDGETLAVLRALALSLEIPQKGISTYRAPGDYIEVWHTGHGHGGPVFTSHDPEMRASEAKCEYLTTLIERRLNA